MSNLYSLYPSLKVECREITDSLSKYHCPVTPELLRTEFIQMKMLNETHHKRDDFIFKRLQKMYKQEGLELTTFSYFNTADAILWVEPLDGVTAFCKGNLSDVTVLLGLSLKNYSRVGIVHHPFSEREEDVGVTSFGTMEHGLFRLEFNPRASDAELSNRIPSYIDPFEE
eukprot:CAMPEP_0202979880 /NCGR_PEP_ID=MMETSP1396-20130829/85916_1 /ASSEMBLY_ACC=CAM_ASM_000872 /TAXON_ID= /ORGANISM="Pseudokeronopsis sp., Strain Brazil" /LENGTH=169 /DNA_ID=CAMNT_0049719519 /DNA_START=122 /DNA_END=631 /DNA_ORIENTATION=-